MTSTVHRWLVVLIIGLFVSMQSYAASEMMIDPYVGISFDPAAVHFDAAPVPLIDALKLGSGQYWLFASSGDVNHPRTHYYVVAGFMSIIADTDPPEQVGRQPDYGAIVVLRDGQYKWLGVAERVEEVGLPDHVIQSLADDAVMRILRAFGGRGAVQDRIDDMKRVVVIEPVAKALRKAGLSNIQAIPPSLQTKQK